MASIDDEENNISLTTPLLLPSSNHDDDADGLGLLKSREAVHDPATVNRWLSLQCRVLQLAVYFLSIVVAAVAPNVGFVYLTISDAPYKQKQAGSLGITAV